MDTQNVIDNPQPGVRFSAARRPSLPVPSCRGACEVPTRPSPTPSSTACGSGASPTATAARSIRPRIPSRPSIEDGLSEVEMMDGPIRSYAGMGAGGRRGAGQQPTEPTDEQRQAQLARCAELRKMYNDAGVNIHIHKIPFGQSDEAIDFNFQVAKALGCVGITLERSEPMAKKLAPFADKHKIWVAFHNHTNNYPVMDKTGPDPGLRPVHRLQLRCRALFRRHQGTVAASRAREVPRPHRQPAHEGQDRRWRERTVGHGKDAAQGDPAAHEEGEVDVPGRHRG